MSPALKSVVKAVPVPVTDGRSGSRGDRSRKSGIGGEGHVVGCNGVPVEREAGIAGDALDDVLVASDSDRLPDVVVEEGRAGAGQGGGADRGGDGSSAGGKVDDTVRIGVFGDADDDAGDAGLARILEAISIQVAEDRVADGACVLVAVARCGGAIDVGDEIGLQALVGDGVAARGTKFVRTPEVSVIRAV